MTRASNLLVVFVTFVFAAGVANAQYRPLAKYKFNEGGYKLVGIFEHYSDHVVQKTVGEFYTDDITLLNKIKRVWNFPRKQHMYACGYHYYVVLLHNGKKVDDFSINLECKEIVTDRGSRVFDARLLTRFSPNVKPLFSRSKQFDTIDEARNYWSEIVRNDKFVFSQEPNWLKFEGRFGFKAQCPESDKDCYMSGRDKEMLAAVREKIRSTYPGEQFELRTNGGSSAGDVFFEIVCNKSLESKIAIYDRNEFSGKWQPFPLYLRSYWKTK